MKEQTAVTLRAVFRVGLRFIAFAGIGIIAGFSGVLLWLFSDIHYIHHERRHSHAISVVQTISNYNWHGSPFCKDVVAEADRLVELPDYTLARPLKYPQPYDNFLSPYIATVNKEGKVIRLISDTAFIPKESLTRFIEQIQRLRDNKDYLRIGDTAVYTTRTRIFGDRKNIWGNVKFVDQWKKEAGSLMELAILYSRNGWLFEKGFPTGKSKPYKPPARVEISKGNEVLAVYPRNSIETEEYALVYVRDIDWYESEPYQVKFFAPPDSPSVIDKNLYRIGAVLFVCLLYLFVEPWIFGRTKRTK